MKSLIISLIIFCIGAVALAQELDRESIAYIEVVRYVEDLTKNLPSVYRNRAMKHVQSVAHWSVYYDVDPLLVAVKVSLESSWRSGARGKSDREIGLMQIHPGNKRAREGFDLSEPDQQIQAGVKELRYCIDKCEGNIKQGINAYATGSCTEEWSGLGYRWRLYQRAVERFRE